MIFKRWFKKNLLIFCPGCGLDPDPHTINADPHHWLKRNSVYNINLNIQTCSRRICCRTSPSHHRRQVQDVDPDIFLYQDILMDFYRFFFFSEFKPVSDFFSKDQNFFWFKIKFLEIRNLIDPLNYNLICSSNCWELFIIDLKKM